MYKYAIARQLAAKKIITNRGEEVGRVVDLLVDEKSGEVEYILTELEKYSRFVKKLPPDVVRDNIVKIPYASVVAVSDVIVVDEGEVVKYLS